MPRPPDYVIDPFNDGSCIFYADFNGELTEWVKDVSANTTGALSVTYHNDHPFDSSKQSVEFRKTYSTITGIEWLDQYGDYNLNDPTTVCFFFRPLDCWHYLYLKGEESSVNHDLVFSLQDWGSYGKYSWHYAYGGSCAGSYRGVNKSTEGDTPLPWEFWLMEFYTGDDGYWHIKLYRDNILIVDIYSASNPICNNFPHVKIEVGGDKPLHLAEYRIFNRLLTDEEKEKLRNGDFAPPIPPYVPYDPNETFDVNIKPLVVQTEELRDFYLSRFLKAKRPPIEDFYKYHNLLQVYKLTQGNVIFTEKEVEWLKDNLWMAYENIATNSLHVKIKELPQRDLSIVNTYEIEIKGHDFLAAIKRSLRKVKTLLEVD